VHHRRVTTLQERIRWVLDRGEVKSRSDWSIKAGLTRIFVGKLLERDSSNEGRVELRTLDALADAAGVSRVWLAYGMGDPYGASEVLDTPAASFLLRVQSAPGLVEAISKKGWRVSTVARALDLTLKSGSDGVPEGGWDRVLSGLEAGRYAKTHGDAVEVARAASKQVGKRPAMPKAR
jgi:hypothetical protein